MPDRELLGEAQGILPELSSWRREIHRWPELGFQEERTAALAESVLTGLGWRVRVGVGRTGLVAELGEGEPIVALRADMDALPIEEATGLPFSSERRGLMHACGHDAHVAMLLGAATLLSRMNLEGTVRLLFQPSEESADEEGLSGAARMIEDGAMKGVSAVFGLHVITELSTGRVGLRAGPIQAAADSLRLEVSGKGAHAAQPHMGRDPIFIAAQVVTAMQGIVSRTVNPLDSAVVTLGTVRGGTRANIIPDSVTLTGTIRTLDEGTRRSVHSELERLAGVARALGGDCEVTITAGYPVTVNDSDLTRLVRTVATGILGEGSVEDIDPSMGAEDFSLLAREARGCFFRLGVTADGATPSRGHSSTFTIDEEALPVGAALLAGCAREFLERERRGPAVAAERTV